MFCKSLIGLCAAGLVTAMAGAASAQVTFTSSYSAATLPGPATAKIRFTIVNNSGATLTNASFEYIPVSPTSFASADNGGIQCDLGWVVEAGRAYIPSSKVNSVAAGQTCWLEFDFGATTGTHTLAAATLTYNGGASVALTGGTNPTMVVGPTPVPTLSEWGLILFGLVLAGGTALVLQRRMTQA